LTRIPDAFVLCIEPNKECEPYLKHLKKYGVDYIICCPSDKKSTKNFYKMKSDPIATGNSLYRENTFHFSDENTLVELIETDTMDSILNAHGMSSIPFNMIKLDTQGSELDILRGCSSTLKSVKLVVAETDVANYNHGCPSQKEVIDYMESRGFATIGSVEDHYLGDRLIQQDILFKNTHIG
jgi:FkbM family methyltransferase